MRAKVIQRLQRCFFVGFLLSAFFFDYGWSSWAQGAKGQKGKLQGGSSFSSVDSTNIDFSETMIDGKMQAPQGFFLQGKKSQALTQMVRLRSKWRSELQNSKSAVKTLVK
jgi:hypothetical protein